MDSAFWHMENMTYANISAADVSKVTDMTQIFGSNFALETVELGEFNTGIFDVCGGYVLGLR